MEMTAVEMTAVEMTAVEMTAVEMTAVEMTAVGAANDKLTKITTSESSHNILMRVTHKV